MGLKRSEVPTKTFVSGTGIEIFVEIHPNGIRIEDSGNDYIYISLETLKEIVKFAEETLNAKGED